MLRDCDIQIDQWLCRDEQGKAFSAFVITHIPTNIKRHFDARELSGKDRHRKHKQILREIEEEIIERLLYDHILPDPLSYRWKRFE
jgi:hypothetical protein